MDWRSRSSLADLYAMHVVLCGIPTLLRLLREAMVRDDICDSLQGLRPPFDCERNFRLRLALVVALQLVLKGLQSGLLGF